MTALIMDDFVSLAAWTNGGGVSISPAGWAYHGGNSGATGQITRAQGAAVFCETKCYLDGTSSDWMMMKMDNSGGALFNNSASDGVGISVRGSAGGFSFMNGTLTYTGWASNGLFTVSPAPNSAGAACVVGIYKRSSTSYDFYLNFVLLGTVATTTATTGTSFALGAYNGVGGHFDYFASYDHVPSRYEPRNTVSPMIGSG